MRRAFSITVLSALAGLAQAQDTNPFDCSNFLQFGGNLDKTRAAFVQSPDTLAWNWFACLNQPASAQSPDRVWETLKPSDQVYLANGAPPQPYNQNTPPPDAVLQQAKALGMNLSRTFHNLNATQQVDGLILEMGGQVPKDQQGQAVRFQLLMGADTFDYIVQQKVYNVNGQAALTSDLNFPATAWELKAAWLWIGNDPSYQQQLANDGYYIAQAYYQQGEQYQVGYAALSGLHVINKLNPDWVWTTFENRHNSQYTVTNAVPPTPMTNSTGPTPAAQPVNALPGPVRRTGAVRVDWRAVQHHAHPARQFPAGVGLPEPIVVFRLPRYSRVLGETGLLQFRPQGTGRHRVPHRPTAGHRLCRLPQTGLCLVAQTRPVATLRSLT